MWLACGPLPAEEPATPAQKVYAWLLAQQGGGDLLGNQEDDNYSGLYSNALAAICFLHQGDVERAERIFRVYDRHRENVLLEPPGGLFQFWDAKQGTPHPTSDRWIGDNAWLLIALNHHQRKTGKQDFESLRAEIARWLISLQDKDGGIWSGYSIKGKMESKSTEGNLDSYSALIGKAAERKRIRKFLESELWLPKQDRFRMGTTSYDPALDCSAWAVCVFGARYRETLRYAEKTFIQTQTSKANGKSIQGFGDLLGKQRIWLEGTGEMVVAYRAAGEPKKSAQFLGELEKAMIPSTLFADTVGLTCHTNDPAWPGGDEKIFVPSQCWYLFGTWGLNPMADAD